MNLTTLWIVLHVSVIILKHLTIKPYLNNVLNTYVYSC